MVLYSSIHRIFQMVAALTKKAECPILLHLQETIQSFLGNLKRTEQIISMIDVVIMWSEYYKCWVNLLVFVWIFQFRAKC